MTSIEEIEKCNCKPDIIGGIKSFLISLFSQGYGGGNPQQSRLNQWKLPSLDKDGEGSEFSRAPGTAKAATSPQLNQLGLQPDS